MIINDGTGSGSSAKVSVENKLSIAGVTVSAQMHASARHGRAYQVMSGIRTITGAYGILAIRNESADNLVITYIRMAVDKTETAQCLTQIFLGGNWVAGTAVEPVILNSKFNLNAGITAHYNAIPTGSPQGIDTRWIRGPDEIVYNKEGSIILGTNDLMSIKMTPETASVSVNARVSFLMLTDDELEQL
jgi:hypothetical protein